VLVISGGIKLFLQVYRAKKQREWVRDRI